MTRSEGFPPRVPPRMTAANEAGLRGDKSQMGFVAKTLGLGDGEKALIDLPWDEAGDEAG